MSAYTAHFTQILSAVLYIIFRWRKECGEILHCFAFHSFEKRERERKREKERECVCVRERERDRERERETERKRKIEK